MARDGRVRVALFRGINVGGRNALSMKELVRALEGLGLRDVHTYIQSGNAVFRDPTDDELVVTAGRIGAAVAQARGFEPEVLVLRAGELHAAMDANPFPEAESEPRSSRLRARLSNPPVAERQGCEHQGGHDEHTDAHG